MGDNQDIKMGNSIKEDMTIRNPKNKAKAKRSQEKLRELVDGYYNRSGCHAIRYASTCKRGRCRWSRGRCRYCARKWYYKYGKYTCR